MKVLLVWEIIPEETRLFICEGNLAEAAIAAHGCFVNMEGGDPNGAADALSEMLDGIDASEVTSGPLEVDGVTFVAVSGFMM